MSGRGGGDAAVGVDDTNDVCAFQTHHSVRRGRVQRPGPNPINLEGEVSLHSLCPELQSRHGLEVLHGHADLRMLGRAAVVLLSGRVAGGAFAGVLAPID